MQKGKRGTCSTPRLLKQSEVDLLRQDAISSSEEMKRLIASRAQRQKKSIRALMNPQYLS